MKPKQVTDERLKAYARACLKLGMGVPFAREATAAAINAMPDDLLRELCKERGCVMVPNRKVGDIRLDRHQHPYATLCTCVDEKGNGWAAKTPIYAAGLNLDEETNAPG